MKSKIKYPLIVNLISVFLLYRKQKERATHNTPLLTVTQILNYETEYSNSPNQLLNRKKGKR